MADKPIVKLGQLLKDERNRQGMTQSRFSVISRVSTRTIVALEKGKILTKRIRMDVILRLALALGIDPQTLMDEADYDGQATAEEINLARLRSNCKEEAPPKIPLTQLIFGFMELSGEEQETFMRTVNAYLGKG